MKDIPVMVITIVGRIGHERIIPWVRTTLRTGQKDCEGHQLDRSGLMNVWRTWQQYPSVNLEE